MKSTSKRLVIIGAGEFGEIAFDHFNNDSAYDTLAYSAERAYITTNELLGLPVVPFEDLENLFQPKECGVFVAITFARLNRVRHRLYREAKKKGFSPVSYVSSRAVVASNASIGENCFVFENSVIEHRARIGNNVIVWAGSHIGHSSVVQDNCFVSSHAVVSSFCTIGESSFLGVNCSLKDGINIGKDCIIGNGAAVMHDTESGKVYWGNPARLTGNNSDLVFK
jgi:sugar O-acyltransferase (sialic acid O-acetyltransferase NeuD family)